MASSDIKSSRNPEIEHIALREALKDLGVRLDSGEEGVCVWIEGGEEGLHVVNIVPPRFGDSSDFRRYIAARLRINWTALQSIDSAAGAQGEPDETSLEESAHEDFDSLAGDPGRALALAADSLKRSADMMNEIVEETRHDRVEFRIRSRQIDRALARIDEAFADLIGSSQ